MKFEYALGSIVLFLLLAYLALSCQQPEPGPIYLNNVFQNWNLDSTDNSMNAVTIVPAESSQVVLFDIFSGSTYFGTAADSIRIQATVADKLSNLRILAAIDTLIPPPPPPPPPTGTALADSIALLVSGDWKLFRSGGALVDLHYSSPGTLFDYTENMQRDPVNGYIYKFGQGHGGTGRFIRYSELADEWEELPVPFVQTYYHAYDHGAFANGILYHRRQIEGGSPERLYRWNGIAWSYIEVSPMLNAFGALEYFPDVGLVDAGWNVHVTTDWGITWQTVGPILGRTSMSMEYSAVQDVMAIMGGEDGSGNKFRYVHRLDRNLNLVRMTDAPIPMGTDVTTLTVDPVSGLFVVFGNGIRTYDALSDIWAIYSATIPIALNSPPTAYRLVAFPYGDVICVIASSNFSQDVEWWLFKL